MLMSESKLWVASPFMSVPTIEVINKISTLANPINRNLQITVCYSELSAAFAIRTGIVANWCTFATWASKQAGVTIRGEDLQRKLEEVLNEDPEIQEILSALCHHAKKLGSEPVTSRIQ